MNKLTHEALKACCEPQRATVVHRRLPGRVPRGEYPVPGGHPATHLPRTTWRRTQPGDVVLAVELTAVELREVLEDAWDMGLAVVHYEACQWHEIQRFPIETYDTEEQDNGL